MFIRKKKNKSGSVSIQILEKKNKKNILIETIGCSADKDEISILEKKAKSRKKELEPQQSFDFLCQKDQIILEYFQSKHAIQIQTIGPELVLGKIFDRIGFGAIKEDLFRHLVLTRLAYPTSKLKTTEYLLQYKGISIEIDQIYRFLDKFHEKYKANVERIAYEHTKKIIKNISVVFYDMTTLYFEAEDEDDLRKIGFSKDGKFQHPQIMLGLLVGENGYPIGYDIFEGNTFEGHTLLPTLKKIQKKYGFNKPVVVADAALLSKNNLDNLAEEKYKFIIGARIKNESNEIKTEILKRAKRIKNGDSFVIKKTDHTRLIVTYSDKRAKKDAHNREKGIRKLHKRVKTGKLTKEAINNRGYNKFLTLENEVNVTIDEKKIKQDKKWDGLKGYITNTRLAAKNIVKNYSHLWQIEKAFRISKTDLRVRPIYHYRQRRIEAHICIAFVAYAVYKELERLLKKEKVGLCPTKAIELTKTIYQIVFSLPESRNVYRVLSGLSEDQKSLLEILRFG